MSGQKSCFTLVWGIQRGRGWEQGRAISFPGGGGRCGPQRPLSSPGGHQSAVSRSKALPSERVPSAVPRTRLAALRAKKGRRPAGRPRGRPGWPLGSPRPAARQPAHPRGSRPHTRPRRPGWHRRVRLEPSARDPSRRPPPLCPGAPHCVPGASGSTVPVWGVWSQGQSQQNEHLAPSRGLRHLAFRGIEN